MNSGFYVYLHCRPDGAPFYVGKGKFQRAWTLGNRNPHHRRIVQKYGPDRIGVFIFPCRSEEEAFRDEARHIAQLSAEGYTLSNMTLGGEGPAGLKHSADAKEKMAQRKRGKSLSPEHREKISLANKGVSQFAGKNHTDQTKQKMSAARVGRPGRTPSDAERRKLSVSHLGQTPWNKGMPSPTRGVPRTPEVRARIAEAHKGKRLSDEHRQKLATAKSGRALSTEHRANVSAGLHAFHQAKKRTSSAQGDSHGQ